MSDKALISLFDEQLRKEIKKIVSEKGLANDGLGLIWWYFRKLESMNDEEIEDAICDGGGDLGIDAIIKDDYDVVHFYQFKNLSNTTRGFPGGDVDKTLSGLSIIIRRDHEKIANEALKDKIAEVLEELPSGYQVHFISTGKGLEDDSQTKLASFISGLGPSADKAITVRDEHISYLLDVFYTKSEPTLNKEIAVSPGKMPYMQKMADHDSYIFDLGALPLAELYGEHGEKLLQQNIRTFEGGNPTNDAIYRSCTGVESDNFYHYNNGVTFLCETANYDNFTSCLSMKKPQIVNGGQTVRVLSKAFREGSLRDDVIVSIRVITSQGNKEFAGDVAVNLNNQTRVQGSFLKSNHPRIVQLASALRAIGWYLERREGEIEELTDSDKTEIEANIGGSLETRMIKLKEGTQAYVATYYGNPSLARLNPAKMFQNTADKGQFENIFDTSLTAEKFATAYTLYQAIEPKIEAFRKIKRQKIKTPGDPQWSEDFKSLLGTSFVDHRIKDIEQVVPQSTMFVLGVCYHWYVLKQGKSVPDLITDIEASPEALAFALEQIILTQEENAEVWNKTWQTLLKSKQFFNAVKERLESAP